MVNNVFKENELYEPMRQWLQIYLEDKYKHAEIGRASCRERV